VSVLRWLTNECRIGCPHPPGTARPKAQQDWVTIAEVPMLIGEDPVGRSIVGCPMYGVGITPCSNTLRLFPAGPVGRGQSVFVTIDGIAACLETVSGFTDGTPQGTYHYEIKMSEAGQDFVRVSS
jgi:hypothetical protein